MNAKLKGALASVVLALSTVPAGAAALTDSALGGSGELYVVRAGTYGSLFPGRRQTDPQNRVLALETRRPNQLPERQLIPASANPDVEDSASVLYEEDSGTVYSLWRSRAGATSSYLKLASFDGTRWSEPVEVSANPASTKTSPALLIVRDTAVQTLAGGAKVERHRTIANLVWSEDSGHAGVETYYSPIIFVDGANLGWNPIYRLGAFDVASGLAAPVVDPGSEMARSPSIREGRDSRTVVVSFIQPATGHLAVVQVNFLPLELQQLADKLRSTIIDTGLPCDLRQPAGRAQLAEKARAILRSNGDAFEPEFIEGLVDRVGTEVIEGTSTDLISISDLLRSTIIDTGARFSQRGLRPLAAKFASTRRLEQINSDPHHTNQAAEPGQLGHLIELGTVAALQAPQVGAGAIEVFLAESGQNVIVSWSQGDRVSYRESQGEVWSDVRELRLGDTTTIERAYEILDQRVRTR
jgi:hypothetical protein